MLIVRCSDIGSSDEETQQKEWLGDLVAGPVEKVTLKPGDTMYAVYPQSFTHFTVNVHLAQDYPDRIYTRCGESTLSAYYLLGRLLIAGSV
jgi:hypothetical protein